MKDMPQDYESEQGLLGSMLLDPESSCPKVSNLKCEDFYRPKHQVLFSELMKMYSDNLTMDSITISRYLKDNSNLDKIGGQKYLDELMDSCLVAAHCSNYRDTVIEKSKLRHEILILEQALQSTYEGESKSDQVISNLSLAYLDENEDESLDVLGNKFIDDCIEGNVGEFDWWCSEWVLVKV